MKRIIFALFLMTTGTVDAITVGAGADYTSWATYLVASSTDDCVTQISNMVEDVTWNKGVSIVSMSDGVSLTNNAGRVLNMTSGVNQNILFFRCRFYSKTSTLFRLESLGANAKIYLSECTFTAPGNIYMLANNQQIPANTVFVDSCSFWGYNAESVNNYGVGFSTGGAAEITNCFFSGTGSSAINLPSVLGSKIYNCTFSGCGYGLQINNLIDVKNCVFLNNTIDIQATAPGSVTMLSNCASTNSVAGWGSGCVSIVAANTFVNPNPSQLQDFIPLHNSLIARAGIPIAGVTTDILGNPYANPPSMGAIQCPASGWDWLNRYYYHTEAVQ